MKHCPSWSCSTWLSLIHIRILYLCESAVCHEFAYLLIHAKRSMLYAYIKTPLLPTSSNPNYISMHRFKWITTQYCQNCTKPLPHVPTRAGNRFCLSNHQSHTHPYRSWIIPPMITFSHISCLLNNNNNNLNYW